MATRGHPMRRSKKVHQVLLSPVEEHSKKPDVIRERIVELMGDLPRVELFARQTAPGWDAWGNEVECSPGLHALMEKQSASAVSKSILNAH